MPNYDFLLTSKLSTLDTKAKIKAMQTLGVPYSREDIENAVKDLKKQEYKDAEAQYSCRKSVDSSNGCLFAHQTKEEAQHPPTLLATIQVIRYIRILDIL